MNTFALVGNPTDAKFELNSEVTQTDWAQLASTAGESDALLRPAQVNNGQVGYGDDFLELTSHDLRQLLNTRLYTDLFAGKTRTASMSPTILEPTRELSLDDLALQAGVLKTYLHRAFTPITSPASWTGTVNVQPLALLRVSRRTAAESRELAVSGIRKALDRKKAHYASRSPRDLVGDLSELYGLNQLSVSRALGVTATAVRKWRRGEQARSESRERLALLSAVLQILSDDGQDQPAAWLEVPVSSEATLTPLDLFAAGRPDLVVSLGAAAEEPHGVLDAFDPHWRAHFAVDHDYVVIFDGTERRVVPSGDGE